MSTQCWCHLYEKVVVTHGSISHSDHLPIWVEIGDKLFRRYRPRPFRFEAMWMKEKECVEIIKECWGNTGRSTCCQEVMQFINSCSSSLQLWNKSKFGNVDSKLKEAKQKLAFIQNRDSVVLNIYDVDLAFAEVQKWLDKKEIMWKQRSRARWLAKGDQNAKFFHAKATQRIKKNTILRLKDDNDNWLEKEQCEMLILNHFTNMFASAGPTNMHDVLNIVERKVTEEMNVELIQQYTR